MAKKPAPNRPARPRPSEALPAKGLTAEEELALEYAHVYQDLRRVLLLAVAMFLLLIALNLLLN
ncbi:MAG: hypothetical protein ACRDHL_03310 [Candidatus Promineifilaceae bacterium]